MRISYNILPAGPKVSGMDDWYQWLDALDGAVVIDGGLGCLLEERGNKLHDSRLWGGKLLVTDPTQVSPAV